jgi:hypothetical protein
MMVLPLKNSHVAAGDVGLVSDSPVVTVNDRHTRHPA